MGDIFFIFPELIIVKCPAGKGELPGLLEESLQYYRMAMALVYGRITTQKIIVLPAIYIPYMHP
jgi:hypothetical protein